jgi:hypothetical protein
MQPDRLATLPTSLEPALSHPDFGRNLLFTLLLWALALAIRQLVVHTLRRRGLAPQELRRIMATTRNLVLAVVLIGTAAVWFDELKTFALSLVAVAAAIVIATKELIMAAGGTFLRTSGRIFEIGDRIELPGVRGDVIDTSLFTTTVLEIGPGRVGHQPTGRAVVFPNSLMWTQPVINESYTDAFLVHSFEIPTGVDDFDAAKADLLGACEVEQAPFLEEARRHFERLRKERAIETPTLEASVLLRLDAPDKLTLVARLAVPARRKGRIEQAVLHRYLTARRSRALGQSPEAASRVPAHAGAGADAMSTPPG